MDAAPAKIEIIDEEKLDDLSRFIRRYARRDYSLACDTFKASRMALDESAPHLLDEWFRSEQHHLITIAVDDDFVAAAHLELSIPTVKLSHCYSEDLSCPHRSLILGEVGRLAKAWGSTHLGCTLLPAIAEEFLKRGFLADGTTEINGIDLISVRRRLF